MAAVVAADIVALRHRKAFSNQAQHLGNLVAASILAAYTCNNGKASLNTPCPLAKPRV